MAKRWCDDPMRTEWKRACEKANVPHIPLYQVTKHTTATALAEGGIGVYVLKALGGWKDSRSAEKYLHVSPAREDIVQHLDTVRHRAGTAPEKPTNALNESGHLWRGGRDSNPQRCRAPAHRPRLVDAVRGDPGRVAVIHHMDRVPRSLWTER